MKKLLLLSLLFLSVPSAFGQILSRTEVWPDNTWSIAGSFTPASVVLNPTTTDSQFKFDASLVSPSGGPTLLTLSSPTIDLKPAFDGGEKALKVDFNIAFQTFSVGVLALKYWDADTSSWVFFPDGTADIETLGDFATCTLGNVFIALDFSGFTVNQLQNFRYQFIIDDPGSQVTGVCLSAPTVTSFACVDPSGLTTTVINVDNATIDWVANGSETFWKVQHGLTGFTPVPFTNFGSGLEVNSHPIVISGLSPNTTYDVYVAADCANGDGDVFSNPIGPLTFTTLLCVDPSNLFASNINANDATINWTSNGGETFWKIEYGIQGFTLGTGSTVQASSQPWNINSLNPNTVYDVYVTADCSGDGAVLSNAAGPLTFTTATLSLEEFAIDHLKLSSNPTHGKLELSGVNINEITIYNLSGQQLFNGKFNTSKVNLDLSTFNTGLYFLKVFTDFGIGVYKIIKN